MRMGLYIPSDARSMVRRRDCPPRAGRIIKTPGPEVGTQLREPPAARSQHVDPAEGLRPAAVIDESCFPLDRREPILRHHRDEANVELRELPVDASVELFDRGTTVQSAPVRQDDDRVVVEVLQHAAHVPSPLGGEVRLDELPHGATEAAGSRTTGRLTGPRSTDA